MSLLNRLRTWSQLFSVFQPSDRPIGLSAFDETSSTDALLNHLVHPSLPLPAFNQRISEKILSQPAPSFVRVHPATYSRDTYRRFGAQTFR